MNKPVYLRQTDGKVTWFSYRFPFANFVVVRDCNMITLQKDKLNEN
jgi:hypothetical protein